jgi:hypothetical protein
MPTYTFRDKRTKKVFNEQMSINDIQAYENQNPHLERVYSTLNIVDPAGIGVQKPPADFTKFVLGKVKANNPLGNVGDRRWKIPKEI